MVLIVKRGEDDVYEVQSATDANRPWTVVGIISVGSAAAKRIHERSLQWLLPLFRAIATQQ
jgi:hypothetical protein